jgi:hypothetical protein
MKQRRAIIAIGIDLARMACFGPARQPGDEGVSAPVAHADRGAALEEGSGALAAGLNKIETALAPGKEGSWPRP